MFPVKFLAEFFTLISEVGGVANPFDEEKYLVGELTLMKQYMSGRELNKLSRVKQLGYFIVIEACGLELFHKAFGGLHELFIIN